MEHSTPHDGILQTVHDERTLTLADLIKHNHATYGLLYSTIMHNHTQHILIASYLLGSDTGTLKLLYEAETAHADLVPWGNRQTGRVHTEDDLFAHLGDLAYERDFVDYFEKEPERHGGWREALRYHLFDSQKPLLTSLVGGFAHPWLMLADAIELGSGILAMDALALVAVDYSLLSRLLDVPLSEASPDSVTTVASLLDTVRTDTAFDGTIQHIGIQSVGAMLADQGAHAAILRYLQQFAHIYSFHKREDDLDSLLSQFVDLALGLIAATSVLDEPPAFDFFLAHILSFCNCVRTLLPVVDGDGENQAMLFQILWLMTLLPFITQQRPTITPELIDCEERALSWMDTQTVMVDGQDERVRDPHFVKIVQLLLTVPKYWPALDGKALRVANKTLRSFAGWRGFGADGEAPLNTKEYRNSVGNK